MFVDCPYQEIPHLTHLPLSDVHSYISYILVWSSNQDRLRVSRINMAVDRMQWGAEKWQIADLYMPNDKSPFETEHGVPCVMLIHGGF